MTNAEDQRHRKATKMVNFHGDVSTWKCESQLRTQILETHDYHQLAFAPKPVLSITEAVFGELPKLVQRDLPTLEDISDLTELQRLLTEISAKMWCNWSKRPDSHAVTMDILDTTRHYNWDTKAVLVTAALAASFGGSRLVDQLFSTNPLAQAVARLRNFTDGSNFSGTLRVKLEDLSAPIKALIDMCKSIVELYEVLCNEYLATESTETLAGYTTEIPVSVYWTVRSAVDWALHVYGVASARPESLLEPWELSSSAHKIEKLRSQVVEQINVCRRLIEKNRDDEILDVIAQVLESSHDDNSKSLDVLFLQKDGHNQALFDCLHEEFVSTADLRGKVVGLYVTDLDIVTEDYLILQQMYPENLDGESKSDSQYEVVWFPVVDSWTREKHRQFESLRDQMEWLAVDRPSEVSPHVVRYVRERCSFVKKPRLVVIDTNGKIVHKDALQMMCVWGNQGFPFSYAKEVSLWRHMSWNVSLLAQGIDQFMPEWIREGKHICLYGGEDIEWIRRFTRTAKHVAQQFGIELEMLYVGKNRARERVVKKVINAVHREKLSKALEWKLIAFFWLRLEKICVSEPPEETRDTAGTRLVDEANPEFFTPGDADVAFMAHSAHTYNPILGGALKMLSHGSGGKGWAAISEGPAHVVLFEADGEALLRALLEHEMWKVSQESYGFVTALARFYHGLCNELTHCVNMILPDSEFKEISCAVCNAPMEKMVMYSCCTDRASYGFYDSHG